MNNLVEKVQALRELAREFARMYAINRWLWQMADLKSLLGKVNNEADEAKMRLASLSYDLTHLDPEHPDHENRKKALDEFIVESKIEVAKLEKEAAANKEELTKSITELEQKMADLQSGKIPVTREHIDEQFDRLVSRLDSLD